MSIRFQLLGLFCLAVSTLLLPGQEAITLPPNITVGSLALGEKEIAYSFRESAEPGPQWYVQLGTERHGPYNSVAQLQYSENGSMSGFVAKHGSAWQVWIEGEIQGTFVASYAPHLDLAPEGGSFVAYGRHLEGCDLQFNGERVTLTNRAEDMAPGMGAFPIGWSSNGEAYYLLFRSHQVSRIFQGTAVLAHHGHIGDVVLTTDDHLIFAARDETQSAVYLGAELLFKTPDYPHSLAVGPGDAQIAYAHPRYSRSGGQTSVVVEGEAVGTYPEVWALSYSGSGTGFAFAYRGQHGYYVYESGVIRGPFAYLEPSSLRWSGDHLAYIASYPTEDEAYAIFAGASVFGPYSLQGEPRSEIIYWSAEEATVCYMISFGDRRFLYRNGELVAEHQGSMLDLHWNPAAHAFEYFENPRERSLSVAFDGTCCTGAVHGNRIAYLKEGRIIVARR